MATLLDKASIIIPKGAASKASVLYATSNDGATLIPISTVQNTANLTRVNEAGLIEAVDANVLPRDFTNGGCGDYAIWPQRTNEVVRSQELDLWGLRNSATVTNNSTTSPDGTTNADTVNLAAVNDSRIVPPVSNTIDNNTTYTISGYFKNISLADGENFLLRINNGLISPNSMIAAASINLSAGTSTYSLSGTVTTGYSGVATGTMVAVGTDGWYRVTITFKTGSGAASTSDILQIITIGGAARSFYSWGIQLEEGAYASAYIPTEASTETRDAMVPILTGAGSLIGNENGIYMEYLAFSNAENPAISLGEDASGTANRLAVRLAQAGNRVAFFMTVGGVTQATIDTPISSSFPNVWNKIALRQAVNDVAIYLNGSSAGTDTSAIAFSGQLTAFRFASTTDGDRFYGRFRELVVFNQPPTNTELAAISTP